MEPDPASAAVGRLDPSRAEIGGTGPGRPEPVGAETAGRADAVSPGRPGTDRAPLPLRVLIPNAITMLALAAGATGVRFAISGEYEKAAAAVIVAAILDGIDGRVARLLRGTSRFGAELDSLSDVTAFGLAPALILYLWALQQIPRFGWVIALALAIACALRLARFNAELDSADVPNARLGFLTGVPAPAGAGLALSPLLANLALDGALDAAVDMRSWLVALTTLGTALLMVSTLPTWSARSLAVPRSARLLLLAAIGLVAALFAQAPWATLTALAIVYAGSIPFAAARYRTLRRKEREGAAADPAER